jgi:hypothetical protein
MDMDKMSIYLTRKFDILLILMVDGGSEKRQACVLYASPWHILMQAVAH